MFLRSLTLKGFKSFAETANLSFEPGVTVVVGPNGSGKSNIVDAVAWVLGAQGPRTVRSSKMEDVIFAGNAKRPALGRAEVSLTIDNSSGLLPIEFTEVTLTRTLFRSSGESEYAINGVPCRLLDVQELLSDTGVGRQQHVIVSQGNLDMVLNARPEDRRLIIEEAAGVLKFRRRKEKAERRLEATEANLVRLQDLVREVRRSLRPLERQAEAARRHGDVASELRSIRIHLAGREIAGLRSRLAATASSRADLRQAEARLKSNLARLDDEVVAAEHALTTSGGGELAGMVARHEALSERAKGLVALLAERRRSAERDRSALLGRDVTAALEEESSRVGGELSEVETEAAALAPRLDELNRSEGELRAEWDEFEQGEPSVANVGEAAEVRGELTALRSSLERASTEGSRLEARLAALSQKRLRLNDDLARLSAAAEQASTSRPALVEGLEEAAARREACELEMSDADDVHTAADAERREWTARADALALALDEVRARAGAERVADVPGVIGTLLELVEIDEGWEPAFEAAAGEAILAVVVQDAGSARRALDLLKDEGASGGVLVLGGSSAVHAPGGLGEPVRAHVRSSDPAVDSLLDWLLASAVVVPGHWSRALDVSLEHPGVVAVTREGDRFSTAAWRVGAASSGATGAALEEAIRRAHAAADALGVAAQRRTAARAAIDAASAEEQARRRTLDDADAEHARAVDSVGRVESELGHVDGEADSLRAHLGGLRERIEREAARISELERALPALEAEEAAGAARVAARRSARARLDERSRAISALRRDLEVTAAGLEERRSLLARRLGEIEARLEQDQLERSLAGSRRAESDMLIAQVDRLARFVTDRLERVESRLSTLRDLRDRESTEARRAGERLDSLRRERLGAERELEEVRERSRRAELDEAETNLRLQSATDSLRGEFDCEPDVAVAAECPELPPGSSAPNRARELERDLRLMGPINPLAVEEFAALKERHEFLEAQIDDVKSSRRELTRVIRAVDEEIVNVFRAAYADVTENYERLFETLFPGGSGRLRLTDPDDLLNTGIELEARPPGKTVRKLSLLSGGERSLTALAFLFAVFRARPSPFYLMDEVEAALDDVNLHRFLDLIDEFREEAQLVIVSHQKRTMEAADCLYGVSMQPGGSTRVISERVGAGA